MKNIINLFVFLFIFNFNLEAQSPEKKGLEIAELSHSLDAGFESSIATVSMILRNEKKLEKRRSFISKTLENEGGDKIFISFNTPKTLKGTTALVYSKKSGPGGFWLYLPKSRKVKRISTEDKSDFFLRSEFAYEDLSSQEVEKYRYKFVKMEEIGEDTLYVVQRQPIYEESGYLKQLVWYNKKRAYQIDKIEYYDREGVLLKTLSYHEYEKHLGKHWRAKRLIMENHQNKKETELIFKNIKLKTELNEKDFTPKNLIKRIKLW